jgi:hypothetical protein
MFEQKWLPPHELQTITAMLSIQYSKVGSHTGKAHVMSLEDHTFKHTCKSMICENTFACNVTRRKICDVVVHVHQMPPYDQTSQCISTSQSSFTDSWIIVKHESSKAMQTIEPMGIPTDSIGAPMEFIGIHMGTMGIHLDSRGAPMGSMVYPWIPWAHP